MPHHIQASPGEYKQSNAFLFETALAEILPPIRPMIHPCEYPRLRPSKHSHGLRRFFHIKKKSNCLGEGTRLRAKLSATAHSSSIKELQDSSDASLSPNSSTLIGTPSPNDSPIHTDPSLSNEDVLAIHCAGSFPVAAKFAIKRKPVPNSSSPAQVQHKSTDSYPIERKPALKSAQSTIPVIDNGNLPHQKKPFCKSSNISRAAPMALAGRNLPPTTRPLPIAESRNPDLDSHTTVKAWLRAQEEAQGPFIREKPVAEDPDISGTALAILCWIYQRLIEHPYHTLLQPPAFQMLCSKETILKSWLWALKEVIIAILEVLIALNLALTLVKRGLPIVRAVLWVVGSILICPLPR